MGKHFRKQTLRLQSRVRAHKNSPRTEEGPANRARSGGYRLPGSMNSHKSQSIK